MNLLRLPRSRVFDPPIYFEDYIFSLNNLQNCIVLYKMKRKSDLQDRLMFNKPLVNDLLNIEGMIFIQPGIRILEVNKENLEIK